MKIRTILIFLILFISKVSFSQTKTNQKMDTICFIDMFYVPKNSIIEFSKQMRHNRSFLKTLDGLVKSDAYEQTDNEGNIKIITVAVWRNQEYLNNAKNLMQSEFKRINFNPAEFYQRLNIKLERGLYTYTD